METQEAVGYVGQIQPIAAGEPSKLELAPVGARLKKVAMAIAVAVVVYLILWGLYAWLGWRWLNWARYVLGGAILLGAVWYAWTALSAPCPYCKQLVGLGASENLASDDDNLRVECDSCHELLISNKGTLRAFDPSDAKDGEKLDAPVFTGGKWPGECIVCGKPATKYEDASKTSVEFSQLLVGRLAVDRAAVANIPYCDEHGGVVSLTKKDDRPRVVFNDLGARRRYLAVNAGNKFVK